MSRQPLFRKYALVLVALVSLALIVSGLVQLVFSYQEDQAALVALQREKAAGASARIEAFISGIQQLEAGALTPPLTSDAVALDQRRTDLLRLLRQAPPILEAAEPRQARYVQHITSSGRHLLALINDILDLSKVEAGRMELELGRFSLPEALESGATMVRERASQHGIELHVQTDPGVQIIEADERKVKQVIFNLLANAVKFTPDGGHVYVNASQADSWIEVSVQDTGVGVAPDDQARIFDAFQQGGRNVAQPQEGTGLGLTLSRQFVELHGGRLWVESDPGSGSTFRFTLPVHDAKAEDGVDPARSAELVSTHDR